MGGNNNDSVTANDGLWIAALTKALSIQATSREHNVVIQN